MISARCLSVKNLRTPQKYTNPRTLEKPTIKAIIQKSTDIKKNRPSVTLTETKLQKPLDRPPLFCYNDSVS